MIRSFTSRLLANSNIINSRVISTRLNHHDPSLWLEDNLKLNIKESPEETYIEAIPTTTGREGKVVQTPNDSKACALCRLNIRNLEYTDVMILSQFIKRNGKLVTYAESKLCTKQYLKVKKLVEKAQRCNLIDRPADYLVPGAWHDLNTYLEPDRKRDVPMKVWKAMGREPNSWTILGAPSDVKKQILALLSPISLRHGVQFMNAVASVWHELRRVNKTVSGGPRNKDSVARREVIPACSADQSLLVEIVASISDLPMEAVLQTTRQVITETHDLSSSSSSSSSSAASAAAASQSTAQGAAGNRAPLEVGLLQFFLAYIRLFPGSQLIECWKPLLYLLRDGLQLGRPAMPQAQFTLLALLHEFVQTAPLIEDRKDQKDLQDVAQRLIDSLTTVVGARLGQSRWLRRALEVEPGPQHEINANNEDDEPSGETLVSVQALNALAEYVAPVLDVVYASDEKEKVVNLINGIMYYVNPYLKNHHVHNSPSFLACSRLLSSISGYQYTRKAWRKDALELLLDAQFFQMDPSCMEHWRVIVDHLMTHDKTTFGDFLSRMSLNQSGGALKLFASRDQESEQRAQLIKRMAFILFCSERDQYHKYTPEIQEKLIESLRDNPSDLVQSQIMLCFRVLIIRSSAHLLTSLWPFVYTEMVQGLLDIEAYLEQSIAAAEASSAAADAASSAAAITAPTVAISDGKTPAPTPTLMGSHAMSVAVPGLQIDPNTAARFQLFLYTCKLLDMVLALPADSLPQFQMYRWSFIGAGDNFEPHLVRIERRLSEISTCPGTLLYKNHYPVLTLTKISNILDLHPFFKTLVKVNRKEYEHVAQDTTQANLSALDYNDPIKFIDAILENDFLVQ